MLIWRLELKKFFLMKKYNFLIVGFGNLGRRYLDAIISTKLNSNIFIFDLDKSQYPKISSSKNLFYVKNLEDITNKIDICFFSSNSNRRYESIKSVFKVTSPKFIIIEKILAQSTKELKNILNFFKKKKITNKVWVNTHYRTYKIFKKIVNKNRKFFNNKVDISGYNWGLACNAIHYIDLYSDIFKSKLLRVDSRKLETKWVKSKKRQGFYEVFGSMEILFDNNKFLNLTCKKSNTKSSIIHKLHFSKNKFYKIFEKNGKIQSNFSKRSKFFFEPVSLKMKKFIIKIIKYGKCDLTNIKDSTNQHLKFISELIRFWNKTHKKKILQIKIT